MNQKGQIILILVLVMTVALAIGLSVVQRSLSDISTSSKVEQSSRAFSAAEAGIEKAIQTNSAITSSITLDNNALIEEVTKNDIPAAGQALEYPPLAKEEMAQVWLANPVTLDPVYTDNKIDIYWGSAQATDREQPALEIKVIYQHSAGDYRILNYYTDPFDGGRSSNNFPAPAAYSVSGAGAFTGGCLGYSITTNFSPAGSSNDRPFQCRIRISGFPDSVSPRPKVILLRARFLYNSTSQPFAVKPTSGSLPAQARLFTATGTSGGTQRKVQVFRLDKVVPPYFDYAIFSMGDINK